MNDKFYLFDNFLRHSMTYNIICYMKSMVTVGGGIFIFEFDIVTMLFIVIE